MIDHWLLFARLPFVDEHPIDWPTDEACHVVLVIREADLGDEGLLAGLRAALTCLRQRNLGCCARTGKLLVLLGLRVREFASATSSNFGFFLLRPVWGLRLLVFGKLNLYARDKHSRLGGTLALVTDFENAEKELRVVVIVLLGHSN